MPSQIPITPFRLQPRYVAMLDTLAEVFQCSRADVARRAIENLYAATTSDKPKKPKKIQKIT